MHNNMVTTGGVKMGKSLGNSAALRDLYLQHNPLVLRYTLLQSHYRSTTEFTTDALTAAAAGYDHILRCFEALVRFVPDAADTKLRGEDFIHTMKFQSAMDNDFNTAQAIASLFELIGESYKAIESQDFNEAQGLYRVWTTLAGDVLGILPTEHNFMGGGGKAAKILEDVMKTVIGWRKEARANRDFKMSDAIRNELDAAGIALEDTKDGTTWRLK
jgi:cysteinyl-tRNA synthetase